MTQRETVGDLAVTGAAPLAYAATSEPVRFSRSVTRPRCPAAQRAVRFYARRIGANRTRRGTRIDPEGFIARVLKRPSPCPRYIASVLRRLAYSERLETQLWIETRTLHDFEVRDGARAWLRAVDEAQRPYPGTRGWLQSCSASEGGHGRWVPNGDGSGAGGWLQFLSGSFWRMFLAAKEDVRARGYFVPRSASSWYSPLGQALAGAWGVTHGRSGEWYGGGCS